MILVIIMGSPGLTRPIDNPEDQRKLIEEATKASNRGAGLTQNLLSFARRAYLPRHG
jgi:hypothetical protein